MKLRILALICVLVILALAYHRIYSSRIPTREMWWRPAISSVDGSYPGRIIKVAEINSSRTFRHLRIETSCSCVTLIKPKGPFEVSPGKPMTVKFVCDSPDLRTVSQTVSVVTDKSDAPIAILPVIGKLRSIFLPNGFPSAIGITRKFSNDKYATKFKFECEPDVELLSCESEADWLYTKLDQVDRRKGSISFSLVGDVPDGAYEAPILFRYKTPNVQGECTVECSVVTRSLVVTTPTELWLGKIPPSGAATGKIRVSGQIAKLGNVSATVDDPGISVKALKLNRGITLLVEFRAGLRRGLHYSHVLLFQGSKCVDRIPVGAIVAG